MKGRKFYPDSLKREIIREVESGMLSKIEARKKYNIPGSSTIIGWMRKFDGKPSEYSRNMDYQKSDKDALIKRIRELERKLEDEQIRSEGLSRMIDIAEEQLKVSIRKKSVTKQSKR
jgi:transposase-like protein